jgi:hypothetical protein
MHVYKYIILVFYAIKLVGGLPVSFEILNDLVNGQSLQHADQESISQATHASAQEAAQEMNDQTKQQETKNERIGSVFDEYVWLDNALQFIGDRIFRLIGLLIKKYIFKQNVSFTDLF